MGIGAKRLHPSYGYFNSTCVGWVERSDTHHPPCELQVGERNDTRKRWRILPAISLSSAPLIFSPNNLARRLFWIRRAANRPGREQH